MRGHLELAQEFSVGISLLRCARVNAQVTEVSERARVSSSRSSEVKESQNESRSARSSISGGVEKSSRAVEMCLCVHLHSLAQSVGQGLRPRLLLASARVSSSARRSCCGSALN